MIDTLGLKLKKIVANFGTISFISGAAADSRHSLPAPTYCFPSNIISTRMKTSVYHQGTDEQQW